MKNTVKIGRREVALTPPPSMSILLDVAHLGTRNWTRACAAALGVCWRGPGRPTVSYKACGYDPAEYGGKVLDQLIERGESLGELTTAGAVAYVLVGEALPEVDATEVAETADFSAAEVA